MTSTIVCKGCKIAKSTNDFYFRTDSQKYRKECKSCFAARTKVYRANNSDEIKLRKKKYYENNKETLNKKHKAYYNNNKQACITTNMAWHKANWDKVKSYKRKWERGNKDKIQARKNKRRRENPNVRLRAVCSKAIWYGLQRNGGSKAGESIIGYLPYSIEELKGHLESLFDNWMTWDNWGLYKPNEWDNNDPNTWTWQIDHIIPHVSFNYTSMKDEDFLKCWALENLRPLSAKQNIEDGNRR